MHIDSVRVAGFRSIKGTSLDSCGNLNVLIGKNNSGKSNLLAAIKKFFAHFAAADGKVATLSPDMREPSDWYLKNTSSSIEISVTLALGELEIEDLRDSIVSETPQVRNALAGAELSHLVTVDLKFLPASPMVAYVSKIAFGAHGAEDGEILSVSRDSAIEMAQTSASLDAYSEEFALLDSVLSEFDEDDWKRVRERGYMPPSARITRTLGGGPQVPESLLKYARASSSFSEFQAICRNRSQQLAERREKASTSPFEHPISTFSGSATSVPGYITSFLKKISGLNVHVLAEQRAPIGQVEASRILKLKTSRGQGAVLRGIQSVVSGLLGVQIDAFSADDPQMARRALPSSRRNDGMPAELDVDDFLVQLNGSGIREALRLILDREFERPDILLVEEPEVHLHPALEISLMQYLKEVSSDCQIFLTTHSTNFLDVGSLENVYLIRKTQETCVQSVDVDEAEAAIPEELGLRLSSLFMFDRLAFVEGPSDEHILRLFASAMGVSFGQAALGFVTTGGARNFTHYATASTLSFLRKRNVRTVFVLDRDERDGGDIDALKSRVEGMSEVKVLRRREMENYLLCPAAISRCLKVKSKGAVDVSPLDVASSINEVCEQLFELAVERNVLKHACRPVIPRRELILKRADGELFENSIKSELDDSIRRLSELSESIPRLMEEARSSIQAEWGLRKSELIPGDEILDGVFIRHGLRFNKKRDGVEIASLMQEEDIPEELRSLIRDLVQ